MNKTLRTATTFSLLGLTSTWFGFVAANFSSLYESDNYGVQIGSGTGLTRPSTYIFLIALVVLALFSGLGYRLADAQVAKKQKGSLPVFRFTTVSVIVSLVSLAIFAIAAFFGSFNSYGPNNGLLDQVTGVYLPIVLAAAVCVLLLLSVTVYRQSEVSGSSLSIEEKKLRREASLAFVYPIVGTTIALLIGLVAYSANRDNPQAWVWVLILLIVGSSIAAGSIYAARTKAHSVSKKPVKKVSGSAALSLNFVLVVIFVVVVTLMSFGFGIGAIDELRNYSNEGNVVVKAMGIDWFLHSMFPALMMLLIVDVTAFVAVRIRSVIAN